MPMKPLHSRLLIVSDAVTATQVVNFVRPFAGAFGKASGAMTLLSAKDLAGLDAGQLAALWEKLDPTAVILSRYSGGAHQCLVDLARPGRTPLVFHIDDDLLAVPKSLGAAKHAHYNTPARLHNLRSAMDACDVVYASTPALSARLQTVHRISRPVITAKIACGVDPARITLARPRPAPVMGYMATATHARDFELALPGVMTALARHEQLTFEIFGGLQPPQVLLETFGRRVICHDPIDDYDAFLERLASLGWWLGLAPLANTPFNACKTDIKWLEYGFAGVPMLASNLEPYRRCSRNGAGLMTPDDGRWADLISTVLQSRRLREDVASRARARVIESYNLERLKRQVEEVLDQAAEVASRRAVPPPSTTRPIAEEPMRPPRPVGPRSGEYERWVAAFDSPTEFDHRRLRDRLAGIGAAVPMVTVILLGADRAASEDLDRSVASLMGQIYPNWELLSGSALASLAVSDQRIRSVAGAEDLGELTGQAKGAYVTFLQAGDSMALHALGSLVLKAEDAPPGQPFCFIYSDEDELDEALRRSRPSFKSEWSLDLFLSDDYACRMLLAPAGPVLRMAEGSLSFSSVYALLLRLVAAGGPLRVGHVPFVLYHRLGRAEPDPAETAAQLRAVESYLHGESAPEEAARVELTSAGGRRILWPMPAAPPLVSLVIPTRDRTPLVRNCLAGLLNNTSYPNLEVLLVDNDSSENDSLTYFSDMAVTERVRIFYYQGAFNYSAINNFGARQARGSLIGLLNNDLEVTHPDWLSEMVRQALRPEVGAVGPILHYGDGAVQHAGVILGVGGVASHIFKRQPLNSPGYMSRMQSAQDLSAVTGACLVSRMDVWDSVGGLDESLPVAFNDVDLCLRIRAAGYKVIWTPFAQLVHLESASRGEDVSTEKRARLDRDSALMKARWGDVLLADPYFSPNLSLDSVECRPAFPPRVTWPWWAENARLEQVS